MQVKITLGSLCKEYNFINNCYCFISNIFCFVNSWEISECVQFYSRCLKMNIQKFQNWHNCFLKKSSTAQHWLAMKLWRSVISLDMSRSCYNSVNRIWGFKIWCQARYKCCWNNNKKTDHMCCIPCSCPQLLLLKYSIPFLQSWGGQLGI